MFHLVCYIRSGLTVRSCAMFRGTWNQRLELCSSPSVTRQHAICCLRRKRVSVSPPTSIVLPMTQLDNLRATKNLSALAHLLGYKPSSFAYLLYKKTSSDKYRKFLIPKKHGGTREICAPNDDLKLLQRRVARLLMACNAEINAAQNFKDALSHGFQPGRSIITNAQQHRNRRFVFNVDLADFFGTINFGRVQGYLEKNKHFSLQPKVAEILAHAACFEKTLPQGSPCSPVISNLIGHLLDIRLVRLAIEEGCSYTRYADDITFSTNRPTFPSSIAVPNPTYPHLWEPGPALASLIKKSGFSANLQKTRMQIRDSRQEVTGLIVNKRVNVRQEYRHLVRAMVHQLCRSGTFHFAKAEVDASGKTTLIKSAGTVEQLRGMLGFIEGVERFNKKNRHQAGDIAFHNKARPDPTYRRFLLFSEVYCAPRPLLICEGKTDNVYILQAIRALAKNYPHLATVDAEGSIKSKIRILKYAGTNTGKILGLGGGTGDLNNFLHLYRHECMRFTAPGLRQPVILLVDNDKGAGPICSSVKSLTKKDLRLEPFVRVFANLYAIATPPKPGNKESAIEDFFDDTTKNYKLDGKSFDPKSDADTDSTYSKTAFAHKVVKPNAATIYFGGFSELLASISAVVDDYAVQLQSTE